MKWFVAIVALAASSFAQAQFPAKPVKMVVAFSAGSETDYLARTVSQKLSEIWGQQVVVENRPGAGGLLAAQNVAAAPGDGYTLLTHSMGIAIAPSLHEKLPYDPRDLAAVSQIAGVPNVLVVAPGHGIASVKELIESAKKQPGKLTFGSAGVGSGMHITGVQFNLSADVNTVHVAYKGGPEALTDLIAGRISYVFSPIGLAVPMVKEKRLMALGVTPATRSQVLADVPTIAEAGLPGFEFDTWYGVFMPASTPRALVAQISQDIGRALRQPDTQDRFTTRGITPKPSTPEEFDAFVRAETAKLAKIIKAAGVKTN